MTSPFPKIEIIAVGSELLTPYYQDTDSLYLTQRLNDLGLTVSYKTIVGDAAEEMHSLFRVALQRSDWIFTIGGLGPTEDDRTREIMAEALERELIFYPELLEKIAGLFKRIGVPMSESNRKQAFIIEDALILENRNGTAPGLWITKGDQQIILFPGPPRELKPMFESSVWPRIQSLRSSYLARKTLKMSGTGESSIESQISDLHPQDPRLDLTMLSYPGQIEIHLTARSQASEGEAQALLDDLGQKLQQRLEPYIFSTEGEELEEIVGRSLKQQSRTLATAESCTGGLLGHRITNVSGSSAYFLGGIQAYSNRLKSELLEVSEDLIMHYGAVSSQVAEAMANGARQKIGADVALSVTGIAGPGGGTPEKPVGLVYIALAAADGTVVEKNIFPGNRETIKIRATQKALDMLRRYLHAPQKEPIPGKRS
jgi:nicotinamide-nucleotide amidase